MKAISRRRFLSIAAASAGVGLMPAWYRHAQASVAQEPVIWQGIALGADAQLRIYHDDKQYAHVLIQRVLDEVTRLERIFSLYQEDSALSRLNAQGYLDQPPKELLQLLSSSHSFSELSQGLFDPSVQTLWNLYAQRISPVGPCRQHFPVYGGDPLRDLIAPAAHCRLLFTVPTPLEV